MSIITVQSAYKSLEYEGLIFSRRGKGYFVSSLKKYQKKKMAEKKLAEAVMPSIKIAVEEGMSNQEIERILKEILDGD